MDDCSCIIGLKLGFGVGANVTGTDCAVGLIDGHNNGQEVGTAGFNMGFLVAGEGVGFLVGAAVLMTGPSVDQTDDRINSQGVGSRVATLHVGPTDTDGLGLVKPNGCELVDG